MYILFLTLALIIAVAGDVYDVIMTEKGLKAGVAVEGNDFLVDSKPSALALYLRDSVILAFCLVPTVLSAAFGNMPVAYGSLIAPVVYGIQHILGGLQWRALLKK